MYVKSFVCPPLWTKVHLFQRGELVFLNCSCKLPRVTRLGEFSPIVRSFALGSSLKITKEA
jgi:hypothetical protein